MVATKERLTISVDAAVKEGLEKQVPKSQRSAFAEKALADALDRLARERALEALDSLKPAPNPKKRKSEDLVRKLRGEQGKALAGK